MATAIKTTAGSTTTHVKRSLLLWTPVFGRRGVVVLLPPLVVAHVGRVIVLESKVTAALRAIALPSRLAPVLSPVAVNDIIVPLKVEFVPSVVEDPTCQKTLHACAPFINCTTLPDAVTKSDVAWNIKTAVGSPCASSRNGLAAVMLAVVACPNL